ncbi:class E sortase [Humidisolicoccus flavus]|uniref:class E sortase n=1 Tax=Humidisolicoccus flavus TaxID=3111414 RepID=UPI0032454995
MSFESGRHAASRVGRHGPTSSAPAASDADPVSDEAVAPREPRKRRARRRARVTVGSVFGEIFMTAGILVFGFVGWQVTLADTVFGTQQAQSAASAASGYASSGVASEPLRTDAPPISERPAEREQVAVMYIPALWGDEGRVVGEGTSRFVLDSPSLGLAHYAESVMPGDIGNFAVAGHRNGLGGPFTNLNHLAIGDRIYVQVDDAWMVYEFRNSEYVEPSEVGVVAPVPQLPEAAAGDRLLTLTTCNPEWSSVGRLISYAVFVGWSSTGQPAEFAEDVAAGTSI